MKLYTQLPIQHINTRNFVLALICASMSFNACKKKDDPAPVPTPTVPTTPPSPKNPTPEFTTGNGTLSAVKTRTFQNLPIVGPQTFDIGLAVAAFYDVPTDSTFLDAGTVTCNTEELKKQSSKAYAYTPSGSNTDGIQFSAANDEVTWDISGSTEIDAFTQVLPGNFPDVKSLTSSTTIYKISDYTLSTSAITDADSSYFMIGGIYHVVGPGVISSTFTSAEMNSLTTGYNYVQIASYNLVTETINGKDFHFVKETVVTQSVTIK